MAKDKIAICVSGQTRHFNENPQYTNDFYEILELFEDYDCDLFGHNWADQEDPHNEVKQKFKEYRSEDQEIIWKDIISLNNPTWDQFFHTNKEWYDKPEYMDILNGKSDVSYIDFAKERIKGTVGQVWSAHKSFLLAYPYFKPNKYVAVIKLRWDLMIKRFEGENWVNTNKERFKTVLANWINQEIGFNSTCLCADDFIFNNGMPYANDHMFAFSGTQFIKSEISSISPAEHLSKILENSSVSYLPSAHTLWMDWILNAKFTISPKLPNLFQTNGRDVYKVNKEWNI